MEALTSIIKLKRSGVAGKVPGVADLVLGELALNTKDGRAFFKQDDDGALAIIELATAAAVQAAIDTINAALAGKVPTGRAISAGTGLTGGGDLSANRSLAIDKATAAQFQAATVDKVLTADIAQSAMQPVALTYSATMAIDHAEGVCRTVTLGGNGTIQNATNTKVGWPWKIKIKQPAAGGPYAPAWGTGYHFGAAGVPVLSTAAGAEDVLYFDCIVAGIFTFVGIANNVG